MRAIIWHLVFWGLIILPLFSPNWGGVEISNATAGFMFSVWIIPLILYLRKDLKD